MIDIGTRNTVIAMVIVLLVLSLLVQSNQSLVKKQDHVCVPRVVMKEHSDEKD